MVTIITCNGCTVVLKVFELDPCSFMACNSNWFRLFLKSIIKLDLNFLINFGIHSNTKLYSFIKDFIIFIQMNIEALAFYFNLQNFFIGHCTRGDTWKIPIVAY